MPLRVMLFDLWGTLIADGEGVVDQRQRMRVRRAGETLRGLGFDYDPSDVAAAFDAADEAHGLIHAEALDISARARTALYLRHVDESLGERIDADGWRSLDDAILTIALDLPPHIIAGASNALASVKALGLPIGLVSNAGTTPGFVLRELLDRLGLRRYFDAMIFSDEVELAKPAPAIFQRALGVFGARPEEAAFIGDQPVLDVLGPRSAGIWSIQYGAIERDGIEPHARIQDLSELVPALRKLRLIE